MQVNTVTALQYVRIQSAPSDPNDAVRQVDLTAAIAGIAASGAQSVSDTDSVDLELVGNDVTAVVRLKSAALSATQGRIDSTADGLVARLGTGANEAAAGNHTHGNATPSVAGFLSAADKTKLDSLQVISLGSGASQAAAGNHVHTEATTSAAGFMSAQDKTDLDALLAVTAGGVQTVSDTATVDLAVAANDLTATVRLKSAALAATEGRIDSTGDGLVARLGTGANEAAAGNHAHANATTGAAGFMSAADKTAHDNLATNAVVSFGAADGTVTVGGTATAPTVAVAVGQPFTWTAGHAFEAGLTAELSGQVVLDSAAQRLQRANASVSLDWQASELRNGAGTVVLDWAAQTLGSGWIVTGQEGNRLTLSGGKLMTRNPFRGAHTPGNDLVRGDVVNAGSVYYYALEDHTSGASAGADVSAGNLVAFAGAPPVVTNFRGTVAVLKDETFSTFAIPSGFAYEDLAFVEVEKLLVSNPEKLRKVNVAEVAGGQVQVEFGGAPTVNNLFRVVYRFMKVA